MKAMLLAAGLGERLYPFTLSAPKSVIPVLGRPIAVQILSWMGRHDIDEVVVNLHHLPDVIRVTIGDGGPGMPTVHYSHEEEILGTAGALRHAADQLVGEAPILVSNSDALTDIDLRPAIERHMLSGCAATLVLVPWRPGYSRVDVDAEGRVLSLAGYPEADPDRVAGSYLFTGCHLIEEEILDRIPATGPSDMRDVYRELAAEGGLGSVVHDGFWWEFGSPELYLEGSLTLLASDSTLRRRISREMDTVRRIGSAIVAVGPGAQMDRTIRFHGAVAIGFSCNLCEDVDLTDTVIMPGAWISPGCKLRRTVVGPSVELPAGFTAEDAMICTDVAPDAPLPESTQRRGGLLVHPFATADLT